jgi:hypothetical protein
MWFKTNQEHIERCDVMINIWIKNETQFPTIQNIIC